ncbi:ARM repeat-containing protein [Hesseltinella vesiculosa]|uniref:ARM repeat-containing protein n=1 Tax=Hesseltinella vesiculosa TaxID=101127 RepID=A0A1X2GDH5_9FUNG|nr:ARM repeat-containing protein [Hesseltinella vesiculosa]
MDELEGDQDNTFYEYIEYLPEECQIDLDYAAPEFVLNNDICQANDMFALGCLAYTIHNSGVSLLQTFNNLRTYENKVRDLSSTNFKNIPVHLQEVIRGLLARSPTQRTSVAAFQRSKYFDNILVSTMKFLECFPEKSREEKSQFMKGLARVLNQFPDRVLKRKILPSLLEELKDHQLLPYTVPNIFLISEKLSEKEFCDLVLPGLKPVFSVRDPPQHMIVLLERLDALQAKTPREVFRDDIMPLVYSALENPSVLVQEKAMRIVPSLCESLDYTTVKNSLFPRIQNLFIKTTVLSVKVSTLICFHSMIKVIDKYTMQEKMVPLLKNIKTKEPAVMLATLAVYDEMGKHLDKEIVATEILPQLWRMSFGPLLNVDQFQKFMRTIRELTNRVEEAHTRHLQEVKSLEAQTRNVTSKAPTTENVSVNNNDDFESLVQGSSSSSDPFAGYEDHATSKTNGSGASKSIFPDDLLSTGSNSQRSSILMPSNGTNDWGSATSSPTRPTFANTTTPLAATQPVKPLAPPTNNNGFSTLIPTTTTATTVNNNRGFFNGNNTSMNSSFSSTPALQAPPSSTMASLSLQPTPTPSNTSMMTSGPNYNVLRGVSQPLMHMRPTNGSAPSVFGSVPLNPTNSSSPRHSQSSNPSSGHKATNLKLFDPLG